MSRPITAVIVGAGHRSIKYADYSLSHPDELKIAGVAEPSPQKREIARKKYDIPNENVFDSAESLSKKQKFADAVINGTMDKDHVKTSLPLIEKGYDMLLEKPFAVNKNEMDELVSSVKKNGVKVMICHVLRYSDFYKGIKDVIAKDELGKIITICLSEDVSYHHFTTSYVRGKWANKDECGTSSLLAKCCHDIDLMTWLMGDVKPKVVSSFGGLYFYRSENAPLNSGSRCLLDCPIENECPFSAKKIYFDIPEKWDNYVWADLLDSSEREKYDYLKYKSPYGRCAFKCDNNAADHQTVSVQFENGTTGVHVMTGGCAYSKRRVKIVGFKGEINGVFEDGKFTVSVIDPKKESDHTDKIYDFSKISSAGNGHGGGDSALVADFIKFVRGDEPSASCTSIFDSTAGHSVVFAADESALKGGAPVLL